MNETVLNKTTDIPCYQLQIIGAFTTCLFLLSLIFNILLMIGVFETKQIKRARYTFLACLSILNLFSTIVGLPIVATSAFKCG